MTEEILKSGFFFDEYYVLRVLEPGTASETVDLTDECSGYAESKLFHLHTVHNCNILNMSHAELKEFRAISQRFLAITDSIATKVDAAKMQAIGAHTLLKAKVNQRETEQKELQVMIMRLSKSIDSD